MVASLRKYAAVALSLTGSAILLFSCENSDEGAENVNYDTLMTEQSENLSIVMSENGRKSYFFKTPLLEGYTLGKDPYREFRRGIHITTYQDDSMMTVNSTLVANYAIYYENRKLWEAKGDVVVEKEDGTRLYTQQLFWNSMTKRIYSNVDTKIVKGADVFFGEGFESDEELRQWRFRRMTGKMWVNVSSEDKADGGKPASSAAAPAAASSVAPRRSSDRSDSASDKARETPVSRSDYYGSGSNSAAPPRPRAGSDLLDSPRGTHTDRAVLKKNSSVAGERGLLPKNEIKTMNSGGRAAVRVDDNSAASARIVDKEDKNVAK